MNQTTISQDMPNNQTLSENLYSTLSNNINSTVWVEMKDDAPLPKKILVPQEGGVNQ